MSKRLTTEEFISRATAIHKNMYAYTNVVYQDAHTKVQIECPIHGSFLQTPGHHLNGSGCRKCADHERARKKVQLASNKFVFEATTKHQNKYDYTKSEYITSGTNLTIICPLHGEFEQRPDFHLRGQGCPYCGEIQRQTNKTNRKSLVYYISTTSPEGSPVWKIGITYNIKERFKKDMKVTEYTIIAQSELMDRQEAVEIEQNILVKYKESQYTGSVLSSGHSNKEFFTEDIYNIEEALWNKIPKCPLDTNILTK